MLSSYSLKPLGLILQEAGLVSTPQVELALLDQSYYQDLKIGEILALRGWIKQNTANFFADEWEDLIKQKSQQPLGYYLQQADLLKEKQINIILQEQNQLWLRFGAVAVLKGWLKQNTVDFFLKNLCPKELSASAFVGKRHFNQNKIDYNSRPTMILETHDQQETAAIDEEDIPWIG